MLLPLLPLLSVTAAVDSIPYPGGEAPPANLTEADKKVFCQLVYQVRSRIPKRVCAPVAWWDVLGGVSQRDLRRAFRKSGPKGGMTGGVGSSARGQ